MCSNTANDPASQILVPQLMAADDTSTLASAFHDEEQPPVSQIRNAQSYEDVGLQVPNAVQDRSPPPEPETINKDNVRLSQQQEHEQTNEQHVVQQNQGQTMESSLVNELPFLNPPPGRKSWETLPKPQPPDQHIADTVVTPEVISVAIYFLLIALQNNEICERSN